LGHTNRSFEGKEEAWPTSEADENGGALGPLDSGTYGLARGSVGPFNEPDTRHPGAICKV